MDNVQKRVEEIREKLKVFDNVSFNEDKHEYTLDGMKARISMTSLIGRYKQAFNQQVQAKLYAKKNNLNYIDVIKEWKFKGTRSTKKGTAIHKYLEEKFNNRDIYKPNFKSLLEHNITECHWNILTNQADSLYDTINRHLIVIGSEIKIFDKETGIGGAIDLLVYHPKLDQLFIIDYKSNSKIEKDNTYNKFMKKPVSHLPDINYIHYSLQTNGYQYILEKVAGLKLRNTHFLAHLNEDNDTFTLIPTLDVTREFNLIIQDYIRKES